MPAGLNLAVGSVELTPVTDAVAAALGRLLPGDVELDPTIDVPPGPLGRALAFRESIDRARRSWTPQAWAFPFAVRVDGVLLGVQWLESVDWLTAREVDSSSWLVPTARGSGIGTASRRAVLSYSFGSLGAVAAISSAWAENVASLGVSRRLGYRETHRTPHRHGPRAGELVYLRLTRAEWDASRLGEGVRVTASPATLARFGYE